MWIPKGAAFVRGRRLFEARRLLPNIRYLARFYLWDFSIVITKDTIEKSRDFDIVTSKF